MGACVSNAAKTSLLFFAQKVWTWKSTITQAAAMAVDATGCGAVIMTTSSPWIRNVYVTMRAVTWRVVCAAVRFLSLLRWRMRLHSVHRRLCNTSERRAQLRRRCWNHKALFSCSFFPVCHIAVWTKTKLWNTWWAARKTAAGLALHHVTTQASFTPWVEYRFGLCWFGRSADLLLSSLTAFCSDTFNQLWLCFVI